jgi:hypothetical protein
MRDSFWPRTALKPTRLHFMAWPLRGLGRSQPPLVPTLFVTV